MNDLIPLLLFAISTILTPGPNNFMIMNSGLHFGIKRSLPHYLGICLGFPVMVLLVALGLGAIFVKYVWIKQALKIVGSIYMLYLAWQILTAHSKAKEIGPGKPLSFLQATLFQWVNPKAWLMAVGAISIFTVANNYLANAVTISGFFLLLGFPCIGTWLLFGKFLQKILKKDSHRIWFNMVMALLLVASIVMMFFE